MNPAIHNSPRRCDQRGIGMIDLLATMAVVAILLNVGLGSVDQRRNDINTSVRRINADFRWTRARAIVSGDHFRFHRTGDHTYRLEHLQEVNGAWSLKSVVRNTQLPEHIALSTGAEDTFEVDSRGVVLFATPADIGTRTWTLTDSKFSTTRTLTLYPSGQIHVES